VIKAYALAGLLAVVPGCVAPSSAWKGQVEWPRDYSSERVSPFMEAGAAIAAAAAIQELIKTNPHPHLFQGCASPEQGLDVAVSKGPTPGLYYVMLEEHFDRCGGGPRYRVLDWWAVYAVTPQGEVVAEAPQPQWTWEEAGAAPPASETGEAPAPPTPPTPPSPPESEAPPPPPATTAPTPPAASPPVQD